MIGVAVAGTAVFIWPSKTAAYGLPKATLVSLAALGILVLFVARWVICRRAEIPSAPVLWAAGLVVAFMAIAAVTSNTPLVAVMGSARPTGLTSYIGYLILAMAAASSFRYQGFGRLVEAAGIAVAVIGLYGLAQAAGWQPIPFGILTAPVFSTLGNANFLSGWLAVTAPLLIWLLFRQARPAARCALAGLLALSLVVIVASRSFQGIPALLAGCVLPLGLWLFEGRRRRALGGGGFSGPTLAAAGALAVIAGVAGATLLPASPISGGLAPRLDYWSAAVRVLGDNHVTGIGSDTFSQFYPSYYRSVSGVPYESTDNPHNVPLDMFVSGGVLLGSAYLAMLLLTGGTLWRGLRRLEGPDRHLLAATGGAWVAYQVQSIVSIDVPPLAVFHWVLTGAIVAQAGGVTILTIGKPKDARTTRAERRRGDIGDRVGRSGAVAIGMLTVLSLVAAWNLLRPMRAVAAADRSEDRIEAGDPQGALESAARATSLAPWQARNWFLQGRALERLGENREARQAAERAAELAPGNPGYLLVVAELAQRANDESALKWFERAYEADPQDARVTPSFARALILFGMSEEALSILEQAIARAPTAELWGLKGRLHALDGRTDLAIRAYEKALALDPAHAEANAYLRR